MASPHRLLLLAYPGAQILDITGPLQMFAGANEAIGQPVYQFQIAALSRDPLITSSGLRLLPDLLLAELSNRQLSRFDTLIVAGGDAGLRAALQEGTLVELIRRAASRVGRIASVCTGAFLLAQAGLLDGCRATTHWRSIDKLRAFRPAITIEPDAIYTRDGSIWTSAGVTAGIDLALAMIESDHDRSLALAVARQHVVYRIRPGGQSQFSAELYSASEARSKSPHESPNESPHESAAFSANDTMAQLAAEIAANPRERWHVTALAEHANSSERNLSRRFRKTLGTSPAQFVERVRVDIARRAILESDKLFSQIADQAGFDSLRRLDRAFNKHLGVTPTEYRNRFKSMESQP